MGCKSEIFSSLLASVSEETEIPEDIITSGNRNAEAVDARYFLVRILSLRGFTPSAIARLIHHKRRAVNSILSQFEDRMGASPMMRMNYERIKKALK